MSKREWVFLGAERLEYLSKMLVGFEDQIEKVKVRAINRATTTAQSTLVRKVRENYHIKAGDVRKSLTVSRARPGLPQSVISSSGKDLPTIAFQVRPGTVNGKRRTPIRVSVKKGSTTELDRAFIARIGGRLGVYERLSEKRFPIRQLYSVSIPVMANNPDVVESVAEDARSMLDKRLDHEINRVLDGAK